MRHFFILLMILTLLHPGALSQSNLCVGYYWTEEQGDAHLDSILSIVKTGAQWKARESAIRKQILTGAGLTDLLNKRPVPSVKVGTIHEMDGYRVINMAIESKPGSWITGNLYEPKGLKGPFAGILCPHGHWSDPSDYGRFRPDMQKRCITFCRMGAVVFAYDMVGYGDNKQAGHLDSLALQIQTRNSVRVVDYLASRPDVDPGRIAVTGASGGGTQSFILAAIDKRVAVSIPVVQVSAHFFGGCICESGMPIHKSEKMQINNVEIAAAAAPRPLLLISDGDDWTHNTPRVEYPFIRKIYDLYGQPDRVENAHFPDEKHDYGFSKRQAAYAFLAKHLHMEGTPGICSEEGITLLTIDDLRLTN